MGLHPLISAHDTLQQQVAALPSLSTLYPLPPVIFARVIFIVVLGYTVGESE